MLKNFYHKSLAILPFGLIVLIGLFPQSGDNPLMLAPTLLLCALLILGNRLPRLDIKDTTLLTLILLWLIWGISGLLGQIPFPSKITWLIFSALPLSYMAVRTMPKIDLTIPLTLIGSGLALHTIYQYAQGTERPDSIFDDTNLLGITLAISMFAANGHRKTRYAMVLMLPALFLTESRTALLAVTIGAITMTALTDRTRLKSFFKSKFFRIGSLALAALFAINMFLTNFGDRLLASLQDSSERFSIWSAAWQMSWVHPWTGFGLGTFHLYYPPYRLEGDHDSVGWMVHMEPLQMAVESGWISTILLYTLFILAGLKIWALRKNNHLEHRHIIAASILITLFVSIHLTYPLHVVGLMIIMGYALAILNPEPQPLSAPTPIAFSAPLLLTLLGVMWLGLSGTYSFMIWNKLQSAYHHHDQSGFNALLDECLERVDPTFPDCRLMAARFMSLAQNSDPVQIKKFLDEAELVNPVNPEIPYLRARAQLVKDPSQTSGLTPLLDESLNRNPAFWPARKMAINIFLEKGDKENAKSYLDKGLIYPYPKQTRTEILAIKKMLEY